MNLSLLEDTIIRATYSIENIVTDITSIVRSILTEDALKLGNVSTEKEISDTTIKH